jgi:hypothetical protein
MPRTILDAVTEARQVVQDVDGERHDDDKVVRYLNNAITDARRLRPDLFLPGYLTNPQVLYVAGDLDPGGPPPDFPIDEGFYTAVVEYIAGFIGLGDDEFAQETRAVALLNRFTQKLTAKGA